MSEKLYLYYYKIRNFNYYIFLYPIKLVTYLYENKLDEITEDAKIVEIINIIFIIFLYVFSLWNSIGKYRPIELESPNRRQFLGTIK